MKKKDKDSLFLIRNTVKQLFSASETRKRVYTERNTFSSRPPPQPVFVIIHTAQSEAIREEE